MTRVSAKYKLLLFSVYVVTYTVFYLLPNFHPLFPPSQLPLLWIDRVVPLIPWTFLVYLSDYLLVLLVILSLKDLDHFNSFARMIFLVLIGCGVVFIFFPTTYPRPVYPDLGGGFVEWAMRYVGTMDSPNNCFPSHHVAATAVSVWSVRYCSRLTMIGLILWSIAIFVSTLTTKQHYFVDILGGLVVASAVVVVERYFFARRNLGRSGALG